MLALMIGTFILAIGCGLSAVAVRQGQITPPDVRLELGSIRMVGLTTNLPDCQRQLTPGCFRQSQLPAIRVYTLWLLIQRQPGSWDAPEIRALLSVQISR